MTIMVILDLVSAIPPFLKYYVSTKLSAWGWTWVGGGGGEFRALPIENEVIIHAHRFVSKHVKVAKEALKAYQQTCLSLLTQKLKK